MKSSKVFVWFCSSRKSSYMCTYFFQSLEG